MPFNYSFTLYGMARRAGTKDSRTFVADFELEVAPA